MSPRIVITIDIEEGATVSVGTQNPPQRPEKPANGGPLAQALEAMPDEPPWPVETIPEIPTFRDTGPLAQAMAAAQAEMCPVHHKPWKVVPAGVSKTKVDASGKPVRYAAFRACPEKGCDQRPAA